MRTDVLGVGFDAVTMRGAVERSMAVLGGTGPAQYVVTPNPEIVWICRKDRNLKDAVEKAMLVLPDGVGISYGARILGRPLPARVPGIEYAAALMGEMEKAGKSLFLLGAQPGIAELAAENLKKQYPALILAGTADGFFKEDGPVIEKINASGADMVFVCMSAGKQECWMRDNAPRLSVRLMAGLGGSLDVFAGTVKRAPKKWCDLGFEWLYRLIREPKRFRRQLKLPLFLFAVIAQRLRGN